MISTGAKNAKVAKSAKEEGELVWRERKEGTRRRDGMVGGEEREEGVWL